VVFRHTVTGKAGKGLGRKNCGAG